MNDQFSTPDAVDIAASHDQIGAVVYFGQEVRQFLRIVGKVGVHLYHRVNTVSQGILEPFDVGCPQTQLARPVEDMQTRVFSRERLHDPARPVGRVVIHDRYLEVLGQGADRGDEPLDILRLVVGRDDHHCLHGTILMS